MKESKWKFPSQAVDHLLNDDTSSYPFRLGVATGARESDRKDLTDALDMLEEAEYILGRLIPLKAKIKTFLTRFKTSE